jgi:ectoine hydrolase
MPNCCDGSSCRGQWQRRGGQTVLQENMTIHFMPSLWLDDGGIETSESTLIGPGAPTMLAKVPRQVLVKG